MEIRVFNQMAEEGMKFCFKEDPAGSFCHSGWKLSLFTCQVFEKDGIDMHLSLQLGFFVLLLFLKTGGLPSV